MPLAAGMRLGSYEILAKLGEGGMGEVYRARDSKLDRDVALKILPEGFAADADRLMRFTREAKTLAALNHPHIAQVYDAGREGAIAFIAMEFVDGDDLAARIRGGAIAWREAIPLARQIADALAAAHDAGIVHRDLKPANIRVRDDGTVKVLDFGLAKGAVGDSSAGDDSAATRTSPAMTAMGLILGTASYMSPEQAKGKPVDRRADVWAFGVVLFEMLNGASLFGREDVTDTLAAVLTHEPDLAKLPADTPASIRRLLARCLAKDKRARLDSMTVARLDLEDALHGPEGLAVTPRASSRWRGLAAAAGIVMFALGWLASSFGPKTASSPSAVLPLFSSISAPDRVLAAFHDGFELSPDGETLAFAVREQSGARQIWTRRLSTLDEQPVRGTEGGTYPFWSPDGADIAFFANGKLRRVPVAGGPPLTICDAPGIFPVGSWGAGHEILFASYFDRDLRMRRVSVATGSVTELKELGEGTRPSWLADGKRFIYIGGDEKNWGVRIAAADGGSSNLILPSTQGVQFAYGAGHVFTNRNDALTVQALDEKTATLIGPTVAIAGRAGDPKGWFAISAAAGRVVGFVRQSGSSGSPGDPRSRLEWVNRQGVPMGALGPPGRYWTVRLSPDEQRAAVSQGTDLFVFNSNGGQIRMTAGNESWNGVWAPDGSELIFSTSMSGVVRRGLAVGAVPAPLKSSQGKPTDWSPDKSSVLFVIGSGSGDIHVYDVRSGAMKPWLVTTFDENHPRFSSDGKWVAYTSDESGRSEVYVRPFKGEAQSVAVSLQGGTHPVWRRDGRELFFLATDGSMMAVDMTLRGANVEAGRPRVLFKILLNDISTDWFAPYDVTDDGQRFLLNIPEQPEPLFFLQGLGAVMSRRK